MKISFCVTYYNQKDFVRKSLESILDIDIPCDFEILVGDDGSTDGTVEEVENYRKEHPSTIRLYQIPRDAGVKYNPIHRAAANRLNLARNATGDFIMFLDGDDFYCDKAFIRESLEILRNHDELVGCAHHFKFVFPDREQEVPLQMNEGVMDSRRYIATNQYTPAGSVVFRNIFDENKLAPLEQSMNFDDNTIMIYMLQFGSLYYRPVAIYAYRQHENSIWNSASEYEQYLLNAMDFEIISRLAPRFTTCLLCRQFPALRALYKQRKTLPALLGLPLYEKYVRENSLLGNSIISDLLNWNGLSLAKKLKWRLWYILAKKRAKRAIKQL